MSDNFNDSNGDNKKTLRDIDSEIMRTIFQLKVLFLFQKQKWMLEDAYWSLRNIWMEAEAKFSKTEQTLMEKEINNLEIERKKFLKDKRGGQGDFYLKLEKTYIILNRIMKNNGMYFKESEKE